MGSERAIPECNGLSGLPNLNLSLESLNSCSDIDPETFEDRTKEGYCSCQEEVFKLVTNGTRTAELERDRAFSLSSYTFNIGFESQIQFFNELGSFENLYGLQGGDKFSCHLGQEMKDAASSCSKSEVLDAYVNKVLSEFETRPLGDIDKKSSALDRLYSVQAAHMNKLAQNKIIPCLNGSDGSELLLAMFELFFENSKEFLIANKEEFLSSPHITLTRAYSDAGSDKLEVRQYAKAVGAHPLMKLLEARPESAKMIIDWIEKNPNAKLAEIFNPKSNSDVSQAQVEYFQSRCNEGLEAIRSGVKASVCGENVFRIGEMNPRKFANIAHPQPGADIGSVVRAEAFAHLYCEQGSEGVKGQYYTIKPNDNEGDVYNASMIDKSERFCQEICVEGTADKDECELRSYEELAEKVKSPACQKNQYSCFEIKTLVRVHERKQQRQAFRVGHANDGAVPENTFSRILIEQGVSSDVVARASAPASSSRPLNVKSGPEVQKTQENVASVKPKVPKAPESTEDQAFKDSIDALNSLTQKKQNEIELSPEALAEQARNNVKSPTSDLVADIQARKRDEEIKKLRSAISDLEQMGGRTREDIKSLNNPPIPYRRNQQVGEDLASGDFSEGNFSPASYTQRYASNTNSAYPQNYSNQFIAGPERLVPAPEVKPVSAKVSPSTTGDGVSAPEVQTSAPAVEALGNSRAPASIASSTASASPEGATLKLSYQASELDKLSPDQLEREGLGDKEEFLLEVVMSSSGKKVLIPVYKRVDNSGKAMWEPQMTSANRDYFERVLEIPLFKDFKRELLEKHFNQSASN